MINTTLPKGRACLLQIDLCSILQTDLLQIALGRARKAGKPQPLQLNSGRGCGGLRGHSGAQEAAGTSPDSCSHTEIKI